MGRPPFDKSFDQCGRSMAAKRDPTKYANNWPNWLRSVLFNNRMTNTNSRTMEINWRHLSREIGIMTDDWKSYNGLPKEFTSQQVIGHGRGEYSRRSKNGTSINTNTAESYFALLKRGHYGIFHWLSRTHTHRYCDEFTFRWDRRKMCDGERMVAVIKGSSGKRLRYS